MTDIIIQGIYGRMGRALLEKMLLLVRDEGEEKAFAIIRREILRR